MRPSLLLACILSATAAAETVQERVATVTNPPGLVAFWDFTKREATGKRFTAHVPSGATSDYALDAGNYVKDLWVSVGQAWVRGQAIPLERARNSSWCKVAHSTTIPLALAGSWPSIKAKVSISMMAF